MTRPLKFRAWDATEKKMWFPKAVMCGDDPVGIFSLLGLIGADDQNDVLMQFTGLYDKNGREIFEGDIIELPEITGRPVCTRKRIAWEEYYCEFRAKSVPIEYRGSEEFYGEAIDRGMVSEWTVIGNIHENPDLKEKDN